MNMGQPKDAASSQEAPESSPPYPIARRYTGHVFLLAYGSTKMNFVISCCLPKPSQQRAMAETTGASS